jgi:hypothetical protein
MIRTSLGQIQAIIGSSTARCFLFAVALMAAALSMMSTCCAQTIQNETTTSAKCRESLEKFLTVLNVELSKTPNSVEPLQGLLRGIEFPECDAVLTRSILMSSPHFQSHRVAVNTVTPQESFRFGSKVVLVSLTFVPVDKKIGPAFVKIKKTADDQK